MKVKILDKFNYQTYPITQDMVEIADEELKEIGKTKCFENGKIVNYTPKISNEKIILELKNWFEKEYSYKEQKFRRLIALNKLDDDGVDAKTKLTELYIEAESKRTKIQMLENEV